ncbi:hypothetical protein FBU30_008046 [Linnemannia zychae]|nr:hypothetical protein FBU30_008046 [Linnemannia zychae]
MIIQEQYSTIAGKLPTELIVAFGHCLDGPSLVKSLQVCHHWYNALIPVLWHAITQNQWQHPTFPFHQPHHDRPLQNDQEQYLGELPSTLVHVRELEWFCNASDRSPDRNSCNGVRNNPLTSATLARILQATPNLISLSITIHLENPDAAYIEALQKLPRLKRLSFDVLPTPSMSIEDLFPLFSRLDTLIIPTAAWTKKRKEEFETTGEFVLPPVQKPWQLISLEIERGNLPLLQYCSEQTLERLSISRRYMISHRLEKSHSLLPIVRFTNLHFIRLAVESFSTQRKHVALVLSSLRLVQELVLEVFYTDDFKFLNLPSVAVVSAQGVVKDHPHLPQQEDQDDGVMVLPRLEHLTIHFIRPQVVQDRVTTFRQLVMTRPRLKSFVVTNHDVDPDILFEQSRVRSERDGWVCKDLEVLNLCFPKGIFSKTIDARNYTWQAIYGQVGKLTKLRTLSLRCMGLQRSADAGFKLLAGAISLRHLTMIDVRFLKWTEEEVELLLPLVPKLRSFNLGPLRDLDFLEVAKWLVDHDRPDIRLERFIL